MERFINFSQIKLTMIDVRTRGFYFFSLEDGMALKRLENEGYRPLFLPDIVKTRIDDDVAFELGGTCGIWENEVDSVSIRATGRTKRGNPVVVYAHVPNYFSESKNLLDTIINKRLINGAGILPRKEFQRLLKLEDNHNVHAIDYYKTKAMNQVEMSLKRAFEHPETWDFLGGDVLARYYLNKRKSKYFLEHKITFNWADDLTDEPVARLLGLGKRIFSSLNGDSPLSRPYKFIGIK